MEPYLRDMVQAARYFCRDYDAAEDLVQDALLRAYRFYYRFKQGTNFKAWLLTILRNLYIDSYQRARRERRAISFDDEYAENEILKQSDLARYEENPETLLLREDISPEIFDALDRLPQSFREVVVLADINELSYNDIAEIVDIPVGTVRSRLARGRRRLQKMLYSYALNAGIIRMKQDPEA